MGERIVLVAASGLAREALAAIRAAGEYQVAGIFDDDTSLHGSAIDGAPVLSGIDDAGWVNGARPLLCAGSGQVRALLEARLARQGIAEADYATVVHPSVRVPATCEVGAGTILLSGVVLTTAVTLGHHVVAMPQVTFTHDDAVADFATFAAGVSLGGTVTVGRAAYLGMNSSVRQQLEVGAGATLGMGATLLQDLPPGETWVGVPAAPIGERPPGRMLRLQESEEAS